MKTLMSHFAGLNMATLRLAGVLLLAGAGLTGCATGYLLDSNVQSFSSLPALPAQPTYRFERLPSQQAFQLQTQLESMADPALFKAGLRRDDAAPRYSVQVTARVQRVQSPWPELGGWGWGGGFARHGGGFGLGYGGPYSRMEQPWFQREVTVIVRELATSRVVYETRAGNDGPWSDSASVLPVMFDAAMQGFPAASAGVRRVDIKVGG